MFAVFLERHGGKGWWAAWSVWAGVLGLGFVEDVCDRESPSDAAAHAPARSGRALGAGALAALRADGFVVIDGFLAPAALAAARADCAALRDRGGGFERTAQHSSAVRSDAVVWLRESPRPEHDRGAGLRDAVRAARALALELDGASVGLFDGRDGAALPLRLGVPLDAQLAQYRAATAAALPREKPAAAPPAAAREPADAAPRYWPHRDNTLASAFTHALSPHAAALWHAFCGDRVGAREVTAVLYLSDWTERPAARAPRDDGREEVHPRHEISEGIDHECSHCLSTLAITRPTVLADAARCVSRALSSAHNPTARSCFTSAPPTTTSPARPRRVSCASRPSAGGSCCSTRARSCTRSSRTAALTRTASRSRSGSAAPSARGASDTSTWAPRSAEIEAHAKLYGALATPALQPARQRLVACLTTGPVRSSTATTGSRQRVEGTCCATTPGSEFSPAPS